MSVERILIYRVGSLGDTVVALPALRSIAERFPEAERYVLTNFSRGTKEASMAAVLGKSGLVHGYLEYQLRMRSVISIWSLWKSIRALRPKVLVYLAEPREKWKVVRDIAFFRCCGIRKLIGISAALEGTQPRKIEDDMYEHRGVRLLRCVSALKRVPVLNPGLFDLELSAREKKAAEEAIGMLHAERPLLVVSIGTKTDVSDWGEERWEDLVARLGGHLKGWSLAIIGSVDEYQRSQRLLKKWQGESNNLCGRLSVRESAGLLGMARLFVGHDSGPMHLAAAVGTTCVSIFSARNLPGEWFPFGSQHRVLYRSMPCQGCRLEVCTAQQKACIRLITVDEVESAVLSVLREQEGIGVEGEPDDEARELEGTGGRLM